MITKIRYRFALSAAAACPLFWKGAAWAQDTPQIDTGDTAWILASSALVMAMTLPGLALFYGGLVRAKNVLGTIVQSAIILCVISLVWILWGYSLAFGPDKGSLIGGLEWFGLNGVGVQPSPDYASTLPHQVFMVFQLMFAAITVALITGAFAERMKFTAVLMFSVLWSTLIYSPLAHWIWGGGWLGQMGALDFAGGAVVHISSGFAALVCAIMLGKRRGYGTDYMPPHNLPMTVLGAGLLWFGWFGFNAGSALGANETAATAFVATHTAAAAAAIGWMAMEWLHRGKPTVLGVASGIIAGLATVTPGAGFLSPLAAMLIGLLAGAACYLAVTWKTRLGYDDSLDVFGIHGVGGILGILATGLLASTGGATGLFYGNAGQFGIQIVTVLASVIFTLVGTYIILKLVDIVVGLRIPAEEEELGLDLSQVGIYLISGLIAGVAIPEGYGDARWKMTADELRGVTAIKRADPEDHFTYAEHLEEDPEVYIGTSQGHERIEYYFFEGQLYKIFVVYDRMLTHTGFYEQLIAQTEAEFGPPLNAYQEEFFGLLIQHTYWEDEASTLDLRKGAGFIYQVRTHKALADEKARASKKKKGI